MLTRRFVKVLALFTLVAAVVLLAGPAAAQPARERGPAMLTEDDIELIKVYEVQLDDEDNPPRITIPRDVLREFLDEYQESDRIPRGEREQQAWIRGDGVEQLRLMFDLRARDYYKHVRIRSQIASLRNWSRVHRTYVLGYFRQHFGEGSVRELLLLPRGRETNRIEMTNFYILTQTQVDGKYLIDRDNPEDSLLLQWGLPRAEARFAAPDVDGWRPYYRDKNDQRYKDHLAWIDSLIKANQGSDYGIEYTLPAQRRRGN